MRRRGIALFAVLAVVGPGCGSRYSYEELRAAAAPPTATATAGAEDAAGAASRELVTEVTTDAAAPAAVTSAPGGPTEGPANPTKAAGANATTGTTGVRSAGEQLAAAPPRSAGGPVPAAATPGGRPGPGTSGAAAGQPSAAATGRGAPITIASVGTYSGLLGEPLRLHLEGVRVWTAMVNARGGLNGHPVRLLSGDDGGDPARHRALMQEFVRKGAVAFVMNASPLTEGSEGDYLNSVRVPSIGSHGSTSIFYTSPMHFPSQGTGDVMAYVAPAAAVRQAREHGKRNLGTLNCVEVAVCDDAHRTAPEVAQKEGAKLVYQRRASLTQPNYTAECLEARNAKVEILYVMLDPNGILRLADDCARQGYHPLFGTTAGLASPRLLESKNLEGLAIAGMTFPFLAADTPARAEFQEAAKAYGVTPSMNYAAGWAGAKLFERAARNLPAQPTAADVLEGLWSIRNDDLGGITYPITFERDRPAPRVYCWWNLTIRDGKYDLYRNTAMMCR